MADLRIVDAPEIPTEDITGQEKLPTGGSGNYSISLDSLADYTKTKKDLADNTSVDGKVNGVRQELDAHIEDLLNPHQVTKGQIGLGNVDNTADADKPVSNSTQAAIISAVAPKSDKSYVDGQLVLKANKVDVYTKLETYTKQESSDLVSSSISTALTPINTSLDLAKRGVVNRYDSSLTYNIGERVVLANGDIVKSNVDENTTDPNVDMTVWEIPKNGIESISDLRALRPAKSGERVYLISVNSGQGEGSGTFLATQKSGLVDDGGTIIASPNPLIFWVRINYDSVTPEMFGYDDIDGAETIQKAFNSNRPVTLNAKEYKTSKPLKITNKLKISGTSAERSVIKKFGASTVLIEGVGVDCAVYSDGSLANYYDNLNWSDFSIVKEPIVGADVGIALNLRYTERSKFSNIYVTGGQTAISSVDGWMIDWTRCEGRADIPWDLNTGTSNNFKSCWARAGQTYGWKIHNLDYSTLISCGADYTGRDGSPAEAVYYITNSHLSMISCGSEQTHAYNTLFISYSWVTVVDPHFYTIYNKYVHPNVARRGCIAIYHADTIVNIVGGHISPSYNNETTPVGVPHVVIEDAALATDNVFFIKEINDIRDVDWGFIIGGYALVDYRYKGQHTVVDKRNVDGSARRKDYTDKALAFRHTLMNATSANIGRGMHDKFLYSQNFTDTNMVAGWGHIINMTNAVVDGDIWSSSAQLALSTQENRLSWRRGQSGSSYTSWMDVYHTGNTTVDGNGFIKAASPIVKLFSDHIELNEEAEQQQISFERLGIGDYLIKGSSGFSDDGWYIETPKDANGNVLFSVVYTTLESGDISVKTYKKKFDVETASIVADIANPVDISDGRWIDIRLNE